MINVSLMVWTGRAVKAINSSDGSIQGADNGRSISRRKHPLKHQVPNEQLR
jgi:hypothetical protein